MLQIARWCRRRAMAGCPSSRPSSSVTLAILDRSSPESITPRRHHDAGTCWRADDVRSPNFLLSPSRSLVPLFLASFACDDPPPACAAVARLFVPTSVTHVPCHRSRRGKTPTTFEPPPTFVSPSPSLCAFPSSFPASLPSRAPSESPPRSPIATAPTLRQCRPSTPTTSERSASGASVSAAARRTTRAMSTTVANATTVVLLRGRTAEERSASTASACRQPAAAAGP